MSYGNLSSMLPLHTALDAFIASIPGRNPAGDLRRANRLSCRFVSLVFFALAGTCSLHTSLCATLRAAFAVQIVYPDDLSLNQKNHYAFGREHPRTDTQIRLERIWTSEGCPKGAPHGWGASKNPQRSSHQLVRFPG